MIPQSQVQQTVQQPIDSTLPSVQTQPISSPQKERVISASPISTVEVVTPSIPEPVLSPEVKEVGVQKVPEMPQLTLEHENAGIQMAKESVPVITQPSGIVELPMTKMEADKVGKAPKKSIYWMAVEILRQYKILGQKNPS